jgi:hypothetical protein
MAGRIFGDLSCDQLKKFKFIKKSDSANVYYSLDSDEPASVELYSRDGKLLYSHRITQSDGQVSIPASGYNAGVYMVELKQGTVLKTFKVLKQ